MDKDTVVKVRFKFKKGNWVETLTMEHVGNRIRLLQRSLQEVEIIEKKT